MKTKTLPLLLSALLFSVACDSDPAEAPATSEEAAEATAELQEVVTEEEGARETTEEELADDMEAGETRHFGAPFAIDGDPIDLADALAAAGGDDFDPDQPLKVSAQVHQVCKNKGCWFTLSTDAVEIPVRVRMQDYGFFVSRNTDGADVIVEGRLARVTISEDLAQHFADDVAAATGEEAEAVEGDQDNYEFTATGISMTLPGA